MQQKEDQTKEKQKDAIKERGKEEKALPTPNQAQKHTNWEY